MQKKFQLINNLININAFDINKDDKIYKSEEKNKNLQFIVFAKYSK